MRRRASPRPAAAGAAAGTKAARVWAARRAGSVLAPPRSAPPRRSPRPELGCAGRPALTRAAAAARTAARSGRRAVREGTRQGGRCRHCESRRRPGPGSRWARSEGQHAPPGAPPLLPGPPRAR
uniref:Uncharacterized protein n=1 Tax=Myotis myotis TaxID=51298 RepID=A0A7J7T6S7_MYOMY|nr:hypothetical protein mMyoMyo1_009219 [Myotis myotis]